ncbi:DUF2956 family protein [Vibrio sp. V27_P1S3P104]|uniref:DUF2956 domain-containing protein n=1 Tax=Vibrio TaxID=662 RepID=UPI000C16E498|nr:MULTISPECIES: DUF2956 domain-containing protein [Vibrio]NAW69864.1 DUF2956 family protein [Vibrio sp. V28_P6S34P95]NAX06489.1 DUF2956 family protein [Vibrio sp. V30_P3S12P165]NAX33272.1 DUF2956 family protein [Vibrio sp. V29_P1S30P107]NAX38479.1 DUF2956 family protein [Vibrio sp. V27_P1S3P104]
MKKTTVPSPQTQQEAMSIAKATQKPGQTKEQTKLIAQGIEKGIALYKKQQKEKSRQADKARKKLLKEPAKPNDNHVPVFAATSSPSFSKRMILPWILLIISWAGFLLFLY